MAREATICWQATPPAATVDETLALFDDGTAWLVVRQPRGADAAIGTWVGEPSADDAEVLRSAGPMAIVLDALTPPADPDVARTAAAAERAATAIRNSPRAVATFHVRAASRTADGHVTLLLVVVASGETSVQFDLDPAACSVRFAGASDEVGAASLPPLENGFVTADAEGLGGLNRRAVVAPGSYGALSFEVEVPAGATDVAVEVAGRLSEALPDEPEPGRYRVRTAPSPLPAA